MSYESTCVGHTSIVPGTRPSYPTATGSRNWPHSFRQYCP